MVCGDESHGSEPQSPHYCQGYNYILWHGREKSRVCAADNLTSNKPALYRAPTFSLLHASHVGLILSETVLYRAPTFSASHGGLVLSETVLYRAPTFSLLLASHGGLVLSETVLYRAPTSPSSPSHGGLVLLESVLLLPPLLLHMVD